MPRIRSAGRVVTEVFVPAAGIVGFFTTLALARQLGPYVVPALVACGAMMGIRVPIAADVRRREETAREDARTPEVTAS